MRAPALSANPPVLPAWSRWRRSYVQFPTAKWMTPRPATPLLPHDHCRARAAPSRGDSPNFLPNDEGANQLPPPGSLGWLESFLRIDLQRISCLRFVGLTPLAPTSVGVRSK